MPTAAGVRPGPHRPGDRSPAAPPADARPPGTLQGHGQPCNPGLLSRKVGRVGRTARHVATCAPLAGVPWEGGRWPARGGHPGRDCSPGAGSPNSHEPLPPTSPARPAPENPGSGERRGALGLRPWRPPGRPEGAARSPSSPSSPGRLSQGFPTPGGGGLGHISTDQDGEVPQVGKKSWERLGAVRVTRGVPGIRGDLPCGHPLAPGKGRNAERCWGLGVEGVQGEIPSWGHWAGDLATCEGTVLGLEVGLGTGDVQPERVVRKIKAVFEAWKSWHLQR